MICIIIFSTYIAARSAMNSILCSENSEISEHDNWHINRHIFFNIFNDSILIIDQQFQLNVYGVLGFLGFGVKMGVRVAKNRKIAKIIKIDPKVAYKSGNPHPHMLQHVGERYGHIWPNTLKGGVVIEDNKVYIYIAAGENLWHF